MEIGWYLPYTGSIHKNNQERFIIYRNFLIFYEIQEEEKIVKIKTVISSKKLPKIK